ncbi:unnamed protein product [Paramecium primaurelia]|uniref:Transmembrane protein n=1 Tax=Paramecium primaurelia TaxID=5886 RepID=A0A8S1QQQ8_PARPR|nr:unnamed protein product [Paramecium primaurelia]
MMEMMSLMMDVINANFNENYYVKSAYKADVPSVLTETTFKIKFVQVHVEMEQFLHLNNAMMVTMLQEMVVPNALLIQQTLDGLTQQSNNCKNIFGDGIIVSAPILIFLNIVMMIISHMIMMVAHRLVSLNAKNHQYLKLVYPIYVFNCVDVYLLKSRLHRCECRESCLKYDLSEGNGCLKCKIGYELRDKQYFTICGDQTVTPDEQCDDGNLIFDDGCHLCQYNCQDTCALCFKGICLKYFSNYLLILKRCIKINYEDNIRSQIDFNFPYQSYDNQEWQSINFVNTIIIQKPSLDNNQDYKQKRLCNKWNKQIIK